jgi:hypothetical protein
VDVTTNAVKVNKEKVTIDAARFPQGATVSVAIPAGAFKDKAGNNFAGLAASAWNFTVKPAGGPVDNTPPVVAGLSPANNATNVAATTSAWRSLSTRTSTNSPATSPSAARALAKQ